MNSTFNKNFFINNRKKLFNDILPESLVVMFSAEQFPKNGDQYFRYRQNSDTFYFSGLKQEETSLLLFKGKKSNNFEEYAFILEPNLKMLTWIGHKYSKDEVVDISGVKNVEFNDKFNYIFEELLVKVKNIYFSHKSNIRGIKYEHRIFQDWLDSVNNKTQSIDFQDLDPLSMKLRLSKSQEEIDVMQKAVNITGETFKDVLNFVSPGVFEYQVEAIITHGFVFNGAQDCAYLPIVASGQNNNILHYNTNRNECKDGDLLLLDFGAELDCYAADITRTIPISGKFTPRQKEVYNAVLDVHKQIKQKIVPGTSIRTLNTECENLIEEKLIELKLITRFDIASQKEDSPAFKKYYMHGVSHFIGLDVHDTGKKDTILEPGMVLSCEPAIYIEEEGFGIRLENDILVTENEPFDLCANIPIEADEIEALMNG